MSDSNARPPASSGFYFIGVTTGRSTINRVFPRWMDVLGHPELVLEGIDHPIHDTRENYRRTVARIKDDPACMGALVTTHKIDIYTAAHDMFDYLDPYALDMGELSGISKRGTALRGHAKDIHSAGLSMDSIVEPGYFGRTGAHVLCLGAGGSALATLVHLIHKPDPASRPAKFIAVNRSEGRLEHMRAIVERYGTDIDVEYVVNSDPSRNDALMAALPPHSLVINATGMGKDTPGSPVTDAGVFPLHGIAWEFNYRGELDFLHQAKRQSATRDLRVEDGWAYFVHGWSQVVLEALDIPLTPALFQQLSDAAAKA